MLDNDRIQELKAEVGDEDFAEVVGLFCEEVEEVLAELDTAGAGDLVQKLHFLKGSAQNVGLAHVGALCQAAEAQLRVDPAARPDIAAIRSAYRASKSELLD